MSEWSQIDWVDRGPCYGDKISIRYFPNTAIPFVIKYPDVIELYSDCLNAYSRYYKLRGKRLTRRKE